MKLLRFFLILVAVLCVSDEVLAYNKQNVSILVNGKSRKMVVFTPDESQNNMPLIIVTHGMNQSPEYQYDADKMYLMCDTAKFVITYLRSEGTMWDTGGTTDQRFVEQTIAEMHTRYQIDPHRVYWSGFSMGSMLMYHCMHNMQGKIAAFAPTSGIQFGEEPWNRCKRPVNLIHCHAYGDDVFHYNGNTGQYSYSIRDYVFNMAKMNDYTDYQKTENYNPGSWYDGLKEVWTNDNGNKVELFSYNNGGHWPQQANGWEIWRFCQQFSIADEDLDPLCEIEGPADYTVSTENELLDAAAKLDGKTLFVTDEDCQSIWYVNNDLETPQNVRSGTYSEISSNPYCWMKFHKVTNAKCATTGNLYTIQMCDQSGSNYQLWNSDGYFNTPPGAWCLFALGLAGNYGQDADYCGLWKVDYEEGHGYTIINVGVSEAGGGAYVYPSQATPQATKGYCRFFTKLTKVEQNAIHTITSDSASSLTFDMMGNAITTPKPGNFYIINGKKSVIR